MTLTLALTAPALVVCVGLLAEWAGRVHRRRAERRLRVLPRWPLVDGEP